MALKMYKPGTRKNNPYFLAAGLYEGRYIERSLKTTDPELAEERFWELKQELKRLGRAGRFTFADAVDLYRQTRVAPRQTERWLADLVRVLGQLDAAKITNTDLRRAALRLYPRAAEATRNRQVMVPAAAVLHAAAEDNRIPWLRVRKFAEPEPEPRALSLDMARALIAGAEPGHQRAFLTFLFAHGWRISEVLRLQWQHVDLSAHTVARYMRKKNSWTVLPLADDAWAVLGALAGDGPRVGRVFPWGDKSNVYRWTRPLARRLKVRFTPHMARHSFATWAVNAGTETTTLMEIGGWRDVKSVQRYGKVSRERARAALNKTRLGKN